MNEDNRHSLAYAIGSSIEENKNKIEKLEKKVTNLKNKNNKLKNKLEEKDKIIDEILSDSWYADECPIELNNFTKENEKEFDCYNCQEDYKKCWLKYFENEVKGGNK